MIARIEQEIIKVAADCPNENILDFMLVVWMCCFQYTFHLVNKGIAVWTVMYVDHFDEIRDGIDAEFTKLRGVTSTTHGRFRDTQFYLEISYKFFCEFCKDSGFCSDEDARDTYNSFCSQLHTLVQEEETRYRESVEVKTIDYLALIRDLYKQGSFRVAKEVKDFNPDKHDGLIYYDCLCLRSKCLDKKIKHIRSSLSLDDCINNLLAKDALKLVGSKNTVQINGTGGKRFYAIKLNKLR